MKASLSFTKLTDSEYLVSCHNCGADETDSPSVWGLTVAEWKETCRYAHKC